VKQRVPNRTRTDELIAALQTVEPSARGGWTYIADAVGVVGDASIDALRSAARFLRDEYGAIEYLECSQAARIADLAAYNTGTRSYHPSWLWAEERV
jgi:hypothetical protein